MTLQDIVNQVTLTTSKLGYDESLSILKNVYDICIKNFESKKNFSDNFSTIYSLKDGQTSPNGKWKCDYTGYGKAGSDGKVMYITPKINEGGTSAALVRSVQEFGDSMISFNMKSVKPTRSNPRSWERAWFMWRYKDNTHHYYFYIKDTGLEVGRKDYDKVGTDSIKKTDGTIVKVDTQDKQTFLFTGGKTKFYWGKSYSIKLSHIGNHIKIWVDGVLECDIVDDGTIGLDVDGTRPATPPSITGGTIGLYAEDSLANYDNININNP